MADQTLPLMERLTLTTNALDRMQESADQSILDPRLGLKHLIGHVRELAGAVADLALDPMQAMRIPLFSPGVDLNIRPEEPRDILRRGLEGVPKADELHEAVVEMAVALGYGGTVEVHIDGDPRHFIIGEVPAGVADALVPELAAAQRRYTRETGDETPMGDRDFLRAALSGIPHDGLRQGLEDAIGAALDTLAGGGKVQIWCDEQLHELDAGEEGTDAHPA